MSVNLKMTMQSDVEIRGPKRCGGAILTTSIETDATENVLKDMVEDAHSGCIEHMKSQTMDHDMSFDVAMTRGPFVEVPHV